METQTTVMTAEEIRNISTRITALHQKMPYLDTLTPEQRADKRNVKLGGKKLLHLQNRLDAATANRGLLPSTFDLPALERDVALITALSELSIVLSRLTAGVNDSITVLANPTLIHAATAISYIKVATTTAQRLKPTQSERKIRSSVPAVVVSPVAPETAPAPASTPLVTLNPTQRAA